MDMAQITGRVAVVLSFAGLVAACATTPPRPQTMIARMSLPAPARKPAASQENPAPATAAPRAAYKVGNPYQVNGVWYYPQEQPDYDVTGIASWYGQDSHGKPTADGELSDR